MHKVEGRSTGASPPRPSTLTAPPDNAILNSTNFETRPVSPTGQTAQQDAVGGIIVLSALVYIGFQAEVEVFGHA